ncbi:bifunctional NUDIX hydrolase/histidine phosphatase family protein [Corynebacterium sp. H127]|uniref:NUDIX hydrolase n=1 Tax=Corynebacterium sp. H127 TaxID=3133418 RepID=UPI0030AFAC52
MSKNPAKHRHENDKDVDNDLAVTGRYQSISADPAKEYKRSTLAAGAVLWRGDVHNLDTIEVAVIHRPFYDDWSLAKGKVDPGESLPVTAFREIKEETGYEVRLGKLLGKVTYPVLDRTKVVYYWTGEVIGGEFVPNDEVDEIRWMSIAEASELLSYEVDRTVLAKAEKRFRLPATTRILYVRHAKAHDRRTWSGDDNLRPLDKKGRRQAEMLVPMLLPFQPTAVYSALPDRCQSTAAPIADELGIPVQVDPLFGDDAWLGDMANAQRKFEEIVTAGGISVIVAQGLIIPDMIAAMSAKGRLPLEDEIACKKGSAWVLSFNNGELTGADYLASPLPVK